MRIGQSLGLRESDAEPSQRRLETIFAWFMGLRVPYETVSNLKSDVLIRSAEMIAASVKEGFGGHCVEHALLFTRILEEEGFQATYVNADYHDCVSGVSVALAKPYTVIVVDGQTWVADSFYRAKLLAVSTAGAAQSLHASHAENGRIAVRAMRGGAVVSEDLIRPGPGLASRKRIFEERYRTFSPFGITAPFYQEMRPRRWAVYYDPGADEYVGHDSACATSMSEGEVLRCAEIPVHIRQWIPIVAKRSRIEREKSVAYLRDGEFLPPYLSMPRQGSAGSLNPQAKCTENER